MKRISKIIIILLLFIGEGFSQTTRNTSTADMFTPLSLQNPSTSSNPGWAFSTDFWRPYAGIGSSINGGDFVIVSGNGISGYSLESSYFGTSIYHRWSLSVGISRNFRELSVGISPKIIWDGYNRENFNYTDEDYINDPFFRNEGKSSSVFTVDVGARYNHKHLRTGIIANNLIPVDLAVNSSGGLISDVLTIRGTIGYIIPSIDTEFGLTTGYNPERPNNKVIDFGIGLESRYIAKNFRTRFGFSRNELSFGLGFVIPNYEQFNLDYAFTLPFGDLNRVSSSHRIGINGYFKPKYKYPELVVDCKNITPRVAVGGLTSIEIIARNIGQEDADSCIMNIYNGDDTLRCIQVPPLKRNQKKSFKVDLQTNSPILNEIMVVIDSDDRIAESDDRNNVCYTSIQGIPEPELEITAQPNVLRFEQISYISQDRGIVPLIFFERNSAEIDDRFDSFFNILTERLRNNPDVHLEIKGYIGSDETDEKLAINRTENTSEKLANLMGNRDRLNISSNYDKRKLLVPNEGVEPKDTPLLQAENRRVDFTAVLDNQIDIEIPYSSSPQIDYPSLIQLLERNPDIALVISADNIQKDRAEALQSALNIKERIIERLGDKYAQRVFASSSRLEGKANIVSIFLSTEGILYKPIVIYASKEYSPEEFESSKITMDFSADSVRRWSVWLSDENDNKVLTIREGNNKPPRTLKWDFTLQNGVLIPINRKYKLNAQLEDDFGRVVRTTADNLLYSEVLSKEEREERLLLLQFMFNEPSAQTRYLEDRLEVIARHILDIIKDNTQTRITIEGHTDITGYPTRNRILSRQRADSVRESLILTMAKILGLSTEELGKWLAENNAEIISVGYGFSQPYEIVIRDGDSTDKQLIGDNNYPEGRIINRRVSLTLESER